MNWDDRGFLLSKNKYNENSLVVEIYTEMHGKISGLIFGGTSKKVKNYLQLGNKLFVNYNSKSDNRVGYFKAEILQVFSPIYFDEPKKLNCINSTMNLIRLLTADSQSNQKIFELINDFYLLLNHNDWIQKYILWELRFLSALGYNLDLNRIVNKKIVNNEILYIVENSSEAKIVPNFLIEENYKVHDLNTLLSGLKLVSDFMDKTILKPNNINFPISRINFINSLKISS